MLDTVAEQRAILEDNHGEREALRTVRRQFHTLKGSGRMVGLTELGEIAYAVEKILNRLLEEDRMVTPAVLEMIAVAERGFRGWVAELSKAGRVAPDATALNAAIAAVEAELPGGRESVLVPEAPSPLAALFEAPAPAGDRPDPPPAPAAEAKMPSLAEIEMPSLADIDIAPPPTPIAEAHASSSLSSLPMIELPEVGAAPVPVAFDAPPARPEPGAPLPPSGMHDEITLVDVSTGDLEDAGNPMGVAEPTAGAPDEIAVGEVALSAVLFGILVEEALQHLSTLTHELEGLQFDPKQKPSAAMVRASHTLCGIHRTGGFPLIAATAKSLEQTLLALQQREAPLPGAALPVLARAIEGLRAFVGRVRVRSSFSAADAQEAADIQHELESMRQEADAELAIADAESQAEHEAARDENDEARARGPVAVPPPASLPPTAAPEAPVSPGAGAPVAVVAAQRPTPLAAAPAAPTEISLPQAAPEALADIRDEVDPDVLPIFLEEAAELFPQAGEQVRAWRRRPSDADGSSALRRTLHTFKGSARMAGAMRLGELTHLMESRLDVGGVPAAATPALFDALDDDLDRIAFVLEALREGKSNVPLPWVAPEFVTSAGTADDVAEPVVVAEDKPPQDEKALPPPKVPVVTPRPAVAAPPPSAAAAPPAPRPTPARGRSCACAPT